MCTAPPREHGPGFRARGENHRAKVLLDLEDAFSGATRQISLHVPRQDSQGRVRIETRTLNVKIPRGVRAGQIIRLAGQGSPGHGSDSAGDLLLDVRVLLPSAESPRARVLYETMAREFAFDPRQELQGRSHG